jgi:N-acetylmuramic acid 6-phosphate etherase
MKMRTTELLHDAAKGLDTLPAVDAACLLAEGQAAAAAVVKAAASPIAEGGLLMAKAIRGGGNLVYAAAGSSGLMAAADGMELPGTFGIPTSRIRILMSGGLPTDARMPGHTEDDTEEAARAASFIGPDDTVITVSASGSTPYALEIARRAIATGANVIAIANNEGAPLFQHAHVAICLSTPPELVAGSTRMGAGTAQKIALNMMSTTMGIALGHVHDGMMVNVQADNAKLRDRATGMVARIANVSEEDARARIDETNGAVKLAVLLAAGAETRAAADALLSENEDHLRAALARLQSRPVRAGSL